MSKQYIVAFTLLFFSLISAAQNTSSRSAPEALYTSGLELIDKNNFAAAREIFDQYLIENNDGIRAADAEYYKAYASLNLYHKDGEKLIENFILDNPSHPKAASAYLELGNFYFKEKNYKKASDYLSKVRLSLIGKSQREEARFKLGYSYFAQKNFDEAIKFFNALKSTKGEYGPAANYYAGYIEYEQGNYDKAIVDLKEAEKDPAYKSIVPAMLAELYYRQKRYDELLSYSEKVLNSGTRVNQRDFYLLAAEAHTEQGNYDQALDFYEQYLKGFNKLPPTEVSYRIGYANFKASHMDKAIESLKLAASNTTEIGVYASYYLGIAYLRQGNKLYAITAFDNARRSEINNTLSEESAYQYTKVSYDLDRAEETIKGAQSFLENYSNSKHVEEVSDLLSKAYLNSNNYDLAIKYVESKSVPNSSQKQVYQKASFLKGMELFNSGNYKRAIEFFNKSLKYPLDIKFKAMASLWVGEAYSVGKRYEEAIPYYQTSIGCNLPKSDDVMLKASYGLGYAYYNTKEYAKALPHYKLYVENGDRTTLEGFYDDALLRLADTYYVTKNYNDALGYYKQAIKSNSVDNDYAHLQTGIVYGINGSTDAAISEYNHIIKNQSDSRYLDDALFQKAQLTLEKGDYKQAINNFTDLIDRKPTSQFVPYAYMRRASSYYNVQNYDKTIADYLTVLDEYKTHEVAGEALLPLQEALNLANRSSEFDKYLASYKTANPEKKGLESVEFESAKNQYFNQAYDKAISSFKQYIKTYPDNAKVAEAKYYVGESYYRLNDKDNALKMYNEMLSDNAFKQMSKVINRIGELEYASGRYDNSIYFYYKLTGAARTKKEQYYAWSGLMESYYHLEKYDSVKHYAEVILEKGNVNISSQNKASLYLGKAAYAVGNLEVAKDEFLNTLNTAQDEYGAEAQYLLGNIFYEEKAYQKSIESLIELNNSFNIYKEWVGKSYLLLADNYLALDDVFQAKGTLNSIIEKFPLKHIQEKAKLKLQQIMTKEGGGLNSKPDTLIFDN